MRRIASICFDALLRGTPSTPFVIKPRPGLARRPKGKHVSGHRAAARGRVLTSKRKSFNRIKLEAGNANEEGVDLCAFSSLRSIQVSIEQLVAIFVKGIKLGF